MAFQAGKLRSQMDKLNDELKEARVGQSSHDVFARLRELFNEKRRLVSTLEMVRGEAVKARHWNSIRKILGFAAGRATSSFTIGDMLNADFASNESAIQDILRVAAGELSLENFLEEVRNCWSNYVIETAPYKNKVMLIRGWDDIFSQLDDHLNFINSMKQSPFYHIFEEEANGWEEKLTKIRVILDVAIDVSAKLQLSVDGSHGREQVQRRWVYLEGLFMGAGASDIKQQLPSDFAAFQARDSDFVTEMGEILEHKVVCT